MSSDKTAGHISPRRESNRLNFTNNLAENDEKADDRCQAIGNFLQGQSHCTKFAGKVSELVEIFASIIRGSGLGPAAFLVTEADLRPIHDGSEILKYADYTYLVIPAANTHTCPEELLLIEAWAATNNMKLNNAKTKEIVFRSRSKRGKEVQLPPSQPDIERSTDGNRSRQLHSDSVHQSTVCISCSSLPRHSRSVFEGRVSGYICTRLLTRGLLFQPTPSNFTRRQVFKFKWSNKKTIFY